MTGEEAAIEHAVVAERERCVEMVAAYLWRKDHPDVSVFACDAITKQRYRTTASEIIKSEARGCRNGLAQTQKDPPQP